ncbi:transcription factor [Striga asiatica]|uniref:Transcription factor n=1 Tax=Striga asiatica TaxID=4170 RepID=A0A5A7RK61_STRAF|nr:transcription factor [Striga asiatica]
MNYWWKSKSCWRPLGESFLSHDDMLLHVQANLTVMSHMKFNLHYFSFLGMDARFHNLGFATNPQPNAFKNLCNSIQTGGSGADAMYCADTTLRLDSPGFPSPFTPAPKGVKRKWGATGGPSNHLFESSLNLRLGHSSSSSESKGSTGTACTSMSKETEEESSMDIELDFSLHLGGDNKSSVLEKPASWDLKSPDPSPVVDLQLCLSSGPAVSDITLLHPSPSTPSTITNTYTGFGKTSQISAGLSSSVVTTPNSSVTCTSGILTTQSRQARGTSTKLCQYQGCSKGARGASGFCIAHGGGRRCQRPDCGKGAEGRTAFCKAHGGGRRCEFLGCTKSAEGRTDFCIAHGGGRRCGHEGCTKAARGKSGLCIRHGGGKRCRTEGCARSAEGLTRAVGAAPGCTKSARGRTDFCVRHGGGKRCSREGCGKSAQGSTDFCKAHGGGRRCTWGHAGCENGVGDVPCGAFARGRTGLCVSHGVLVQDRRVHGGATVGAGSQGSKVDGNCVFVGEGVAYAEFGSKQAASLPVGSNSVSTGKVPEGRVHGGNLMAMITRNHGFGFSGSNKGIAGPSGPGESVMTHRTWM